MIVEALIIAIPLITLSYIGHRLCETLIEIRDALRRR